MAEELRTNVSDNETFTSMMAAMAQLQNMEMTNEQYTGRSGDFVAIQPAFKTIDELIWEVVKVLEEAPATQRESTLMETFSKDA